MSKEIEDEKPIEMKAILLGNSGVGKTNLINTCVGLKFEEGNNPTTSGSFAQKKILIGNKNITINLWDTAGEEVYKSITKIFLKKSEIVVFVYDITDKQSFKDLEDWIDLCKNMIDNDYVCGIVGNKADLYLNEQVKEEEGKKYAESKSMQFQLVSAKQNPTSFINLLTDLVIEHKGFSKEEAKDVVILKKENTIVNKNQKCKC